MAKRKPSVPERPAAGIIEQVETFCRPLRPHVAAEPSLINYVSIRKYRVTIELIDETDEVIHERIRLLWRRCDNYKHWYPLRAEAARYGLVLDDAERGVEAGR